MADWYAFDCPNCPSAFEVDATARTQLLREGCVRCGTAVPASAFTRLSETPPTVP